jgi:hypothetical protein
MATKTNSELLAYELNAITGKLTSRLLTAEEIAEKEKMKTDFLKLETEQKAKQAARESALAKLAALGLTEEEIGAL